MSKQGPSNCPFNPSVPASLVGLIAGALSFFVYAAGGILTWWPPTFLTAVKSIIAGIVGIVAALIALAAAFNAMTSYRDCRDSSSAGGGLGSVAPQVGGGKGSPMPGPRP